MVHIKLSLGFPGDEYMEEMRTLCHLIQISSLLNVSMQLCMNNVQYKLALNYKKRSYYNFTF